MAKCTVCIQVLQNGQLLPSFHDVKYKDTIKDEKDAWHVHSLLYVRDFSRWLHLKREHYLVDDLVR